MDASVRYAKLSSEKDDILSDKQVVRGEQNVVAGGATEISRAFDSAKGDDEWLYRVEHLSRRVL